MNIIADIMAKIPKILFGLFIAIVISKYNAARVSINAIASAMDANALVILYLSLLDNAKMKKSADIAVNAAPVACIFDGDVSDKVYNADNTKSTAAKAEIGFMAKTFGVNSVLIFELGISTMGDRHHRALRMYRAFIAVVKNIPLKYPMSVS